MITSISDYLIHTAGKSPGAPALQDRNVLYTYEQLTMDVELAARAYAGLGLPPAARVAIYLDKCLECVVAMLGAWRAGYIAVPINPKLKSGQVKHILQDSGASVFITTLFRWDDISRQMDGQNLDLIILGTSSADPAKKNCRSLRLWSDWMAFADGVRARGHRTIDQDPAALLYTSGSTGMPKGVVVSHRNLVAGCEAVNAYLGTKSDDVILSLLPLSFDAGLSQLTTSIAAGSSLVLHNYLRAQDVPVVCAQSKVTSITAVPPLWMQISAIPWDNEAERIRIFANTGGHMPTALLGRLRALYRNARPFLMYGLTEAFRSTYLDPRQVDERPDSIGKAIPDNDILVLRPDGILCDDDEPGELVHRGALVALGYWNDPQRTAERFRPLPYGMAEGLIPQTAVWSGDIVRRDSEGYLYFVGRKDEQIKVSGYRVSPTEIESTLLELDAVKEAVVFGVPDDALGQVPVAMVVLEGEQLDEAALKSHCARQLPSYMTPKIVLQSELPRSPNGKFDRAALRDIYLTANT